MFDGLSKYIGATLKEGWEWLAGSGVLALLGLVDSMTKGAIPLWIWAIAVFAGVLIAQFKAWQKRGAKVDTLITERDELKQQMAAVADQAAWRHELALLWEKGVPIRNKSITEIHNLNLAALETEGQAWIDECENKIREKSPVNAVLFRKLGTYGRNPVQTRYLTQEHFKWETEMTEYLRRVKELAQGLHLSDSSSGVFGHMGSVGTAGSVASSTIASSPYILGVVAGTTATTASPVLSTINKPPNVLR